MTLLNQFSVHAKAVSLGQAINIQVNICFLGTEQLHFFMVQNKRLFFLMRGSGQLRNCHPRILLAWSFLWSSVVQKGKCISSPACSVSFFFLMSCGRIQDTRGFSFSCSSRCLEADAQEDDGKSLLTGYTSCRGSAMQSP